MSKIKLTVFATVAIFAAFLLCGCAKKWEISFDTDGGSEIPIQKVDNGARIIKPENPIKAGYTFVRWTCFDEPWSFVENTVTEDLTLKAVWFANQYEIKIKDGTKVDTKRIEFGKEYKLNEPTKEGYSFAGYYLNNELFDLTGTYKWPYNIELTTKWTINTYTATFVAFGQQVGTTTFTIEDNELKNIPKYTKYGYPVAWHYTIEAHNITINSDTICLGTYEQDNDNSSKEPIEWIVLEERGKAILLLSKYGLDNIPYNEVYAPTTWETSNVRKWLNGSFMQSAFTEKERSKLILSDVSAHKYTNWDIDAGKDTKDYIYLLSVPEVEKYFPSDQRRRCPITEYAIAKGVINNAIWQSGWWLTRSVGHDIVQVTIVGESGAFYALNEVNFNHSSVRPAMWVVINE